MNQKKHIRSLILLGASFAAMSVSACTFDPDFVDKLFKNDMATKPQTTEELLNAQGSWSLIEDKPAPSPFQQHVNARSAVDPTKSASGSYVPEFRTATQNEQDINFRLLRMERAVSGLRRDLNKLLPPLSNLIVSDTRLDRVIREIAAQPSGGSGQEPGPFAAHDSAFAPVTVSPSLQGQTRPSASLVPQPQKASAPPMDAMSKAYKKPAKASQKRKASKPHSHAGAKGVRAVRIGTYPNRTRLVLDVAKKSPFQFDIDNNEKLMIVELPSSPWSAAAQRTLSSNPLVAGYTAQDNGSGGTVLVIELKKPAKVQRYSDLPPNKKYGHRIYFDIVPL